jgi:hypothetical protein
MEVNNDRSNLGMAAAVVAAVVLMGLAGCGGSTAMRGANAPFTRVFTPLVPEFLNGPAGALLTNSGGFSARATYESITPLAASGVDVMEGELLVQGSRLLFAPRRSETAKKEIQLGGFSFIWDVATGSGYVLSEALQAYAPVASTLRVTDVKVEPGAGNRAEESAVVTLNNGTGWQFRVSRAADAKGLPSRISSVTNAPAFTLKLARIRLEAPPANLFVPPEEFAKYPSPEALADELAARKSGIRRGHSAER